LDQAVASHLEYLSTVAGGEVEVISRTLDDRGWIVAYLLDDGPVRYYHYNTEDKEARFLFSSRQALEDLPLAKMHSEVIRSRDGLELVTTQIPDSLFGTILGLAATFEFSIESSCLKSSLAGVSL